MLNYPDKTVIVSRVLGMAVAVASGILFYSAIFI